MERQTISIIRLALGATAAAFFMAQAARMMAAHIDPLPVGLMLAGAAAMHKLIAQPAWREARRAKRSQRSATTMKEKEGGRSCA